MKSRAEIRKRQRELALEKEYHAKAYSRMGQREMLSGEGNQCREAMAKCQGQIEILEWGLESERSMYEQRNL